MKVYNGNNSRRFLFEDAETKPAAPTETESPSPAPTTDTNATPSAEGAVGDNTKPAEEETKAAEPLNVGGVEIPNDDPNVALVIKYIIETALKAGKEKFDAEIASIASKLNKKPGELDQDYKNAIIWKLI